VPKLNHLPRLWRYLPPTVFPAPDIVALYDKKLNLVRINRDLFETMSEEDKREAMRTHESLRYCAKGGLWPYRPAAAPEKEAA
jgi:hypothetical protein